MVENALIFPRQPDLESPDDPRLVYKVFIPAEDGIGMRGRYQEPTQDERGPGGCVGPDEKSEKSNNYDVRCPGQVLPVMDRCMCWCVDHMRQKRGHVYRWDFCRICGRGLPSGWDYRRARSTPAD